MNTAWGAAREVAPGALLVVVGLSLAGVGAYADANAGVLSGETVRVTGSVVDSAVVTDDAGNHYAVVRYRYEVDGREYASDRVFADGRRPLSAARARSVVDRFPAGATPTVYVDAEVPGRAHLLGGQGSPLYRGLAVAGVAAALVGLLAAWARAFGLGG